MFNYTVLRFVDRFYSFLLNIFYSDDLKPVSVNERPLEYGFAFDMIGKYGIKRVLDVGCGKSAFPRVLSDCGLDVTAIDEKVGYRNGGFVNTHYPVVSDDICNSSLSGNVFDGVFCISTLEHIVDFDDAVFNMVSVLKPGGYLILSFPFSSSDFVFDVYDLPLSCKRFSDVGYVAHSFCDDNIVSWYS